MKNIKLAIILTLVYIFLIGEVCGIGETGAQFLKIGVGAKACAMGEAFVGIADDPTASYWNPAGLTQLNQFEILAMQNFWLLDMSYQYLAFALPSRMGNFGLAIAYSSSGKIPKYEDFRKTGEYSAYDAAGTISYANRISNLSFGIGLKFIQQKIEQEDAFGFATDFGLFYQAKSPETYGERRQYSRSESYREEPIQGLRAGIVVQNLGPSMKFIEKADPLPMNIKAGISYKIGSLLLAGDINKPIDNNFKGNLGGEFSIRDILFLRAGFNTANTFSGGIGLTLSRLAVDYAFTPYKDIDSNHRISARIRL